MIPGESDKHSQVCLGVVSDVFDLVTMISGARSRAGESDPVIIATKGAFLMLRTAQGLK